MLQELTVRIRAGNQGGIMRNLIIVFISLFTFCIGISGQQKCKLNVGSFNLRYDNEGDKDDSWVHRKDMAVSGSFP